LLEGPRISRNENLNDGFRESPNDSLRGSKARADRGIVRCAGAIRAE
jgi:hypothetical protein